MVVIVEGDAGAVGLHDVALDVLFAVDDRSGETSLWSHVRQRDRPGSAGKLGPWRGPHGSR